jgi:hypothetical protein
MESQTLSTLRPLRLGELLDRAIRLYRANFLTFVGIIAVVYIPLTVLQTAANALMTGGVRGGFGAPGGFNGYAYLIGTLSFIGLLFVQVILVQGIATGALTRAVADNYLGKKTGILDAYRGIGKSWLTLLTALGFVLILYFVLVVWWIVVPCLGWVTGLGMMFFLTAAVNPLIPAVVVLEASGPWSSPTDGAFDRLGNWLQRSILSIYRAWSLARRRFWPLLGYVLVLYLFSLIVVNGPAAVASFLLGELVPPLGDTTTQAVMAAIIQGLVQLVGILIYLPLQLAAFTLIYFDLRVRTEGFDLAVLTMENSGSTDLSAAMTAPVPQVNERLITGPDLGNFALLELAGFGLYLFVIFFLMAIVFLFAMLFS